MKRFLFLILIALSSITTEAQENYNGNISFPLTDSTDEAGQVYKRKGFLHSFNYYQELETLEIHIKVKFFSATSIELKRFAPSYNRSFTITNETFVLSATGAVVGDREKMRSLYGVVQRAATDSTPIKWRQSQVPGYGDSTTVPCIGQYNYMTKLFDNNNRLNQIIKNLAVIVAGEGKLN